MRFTNQKTLTLCLTLILTALFALPVCGEEHGYSKYVRSHLQRVISDSTDVYGSAKTGMWIATIDTATGRLPDKPLPNQLRWYRKITSPEGSNLYWDQPTILAAYRLSELTGDNRYAAAADQYTRDFLARCIAPKSGLFMWGNHIYYDVVTDQILPFSGSYHECRPHTPAWEVFWKHDPTATERAIRAMGAAHIKDPQSGRFCRHASWKVVPGEFSESEVKNAKPFLEAGASLIDSLCWLSKKTGDDRPAELALRAARYSYAQRDADTGLIRNQPVDKRWDYYASTTEVGLWAGCLIRATEYTGHKEFQQIAEASLRAWFRYGYDAESKKYFGRLSVATGKPQSPEYPRGYIPPMYAEVFDIHVHPTHNYPMPMAKACLSLYEKTGDLFFKEAVERWVTHVRCSLPANEGQGAYAEDYGRAIHFLVRASKSLKCNQYEDLARQVADEAIDRLYVNESGMFRSHPGEDRCDAVDGPGILLLALLYLDKGQEPISAFSF